MTVEIATPARMTTTTAAALDATLNASTAEAEANHLVLDGMAKTELEAGTAGGSETVTGTAMGAETETGMEVMAEGATAAMTGGVTGSTTADKIETATTGVLDLLAARLPRVHARPSQSHAAEDKAKPNFGNSGLLAAATKTVQHGDGTKTVLKYHEPPEARKPTVGWRLYVFKGKEQVDLLHIQRQSAYLIGRDKAVVDIPIDHPSCSKQHAAIQYRQVQEKNEFGDVKSAIKPFIIDLESTNGTIVNDSPIPTSRYFELMLGDGDA
ncbi:hypothetical protein GSI_15208 [Ganoderma sinense ZZ0214-1]|uniref:FHA domain-containing protein n=1 Tax=Ganoderma sinense ZZ0214-1 TaxID=1077348 RepID=A0A2G8RLX8_9APHY|nr:hypothetical protein GSI_15208 [Ganoderma sinense ZZ0214-1]